MKDKVCMIDNGNGGIETVRELELRIYCGYLIVSPVILGSCSFFREGEVGGLTGGVGGRLLLDSHECLLWIAVNEMD